MKHYNTHQLENVLDTHAAVHALSEAFRALAHGDAVLKPRQRLHAGGTAFSTMSAMLPRIGYCGAKVYTFNGEGYTFIILLFSTISGRLLATFDAAGLTALRTAATSALAATHLARPDSEVLTVFGTGPQARAHILALTSVLPIAEVRVVGRSKTKEFASALSRELSIRVVGCEPEAAVRESSVIVTATRSKIPLFRGEMISPGTFLCSVGSSKPDHSELDPVAVTRSGTIVVEMKEHAMHETGNLIKAAAIGALDWSRVRDLADVVTGKVPGRVSANEITLFDSVGLALEDVAIAAAVYRRLNDIETPQKGLA